jgi:serine/threonine-protein kinase HipA
MKRAKVFVNNKFSGYLEEITKGKEYRFSYLEGYSGDGVSLTMPVNRKAYLFDRFPPFFEGLLPEGAMLEALLKKRKIDADDYLEQLLCVGKEVVGNVSIEKDE